LLKVGIEVANKMLRLRDMAEVSTEYAAELLGQHALANALSATQHNRDFTCPVRVLNRVGHPVEEVIGMFFVAAADVVAEMGEVETAIASASFAAVSSPQVETAIFCAMRCIHNAVVLPSVRVIDPPPA